MTTAGTTAAGRPARARARRVLPAIDRQAWRRLIWTGLAAVLLASAYLLWFRDSYFVKVETVTVTGLTSQDGGRVRAALAAAATQMTTLHVDPERLEQATAAFPAVRSIEVETSFPSGMRIHVTEHRPAAILMSGSRRVAVAADGSILSGMPVSRKLPLVRLDRALPERRMAPGSALSAVQVAAGLPTALAGRVGEVTRSGAKGIVVPIEDGPKLIFGTAARVRAKWAAAVRVLADRGSAGATYVDVRIPERPVAGGLPVATVAPVAPAAEPVASGPPAAGEGPATTPPAGPEPPGAARAPAAEAPGAGPAPETRSPVAQPQVGEAGGAVANPQP